MTAVLALPHVSGWMAFALIASSVPVLVLAAIVTLKEQRHFVVAALAAIGLAGLLIVSQTHSVLATILVPCDWMGCFWDSILGWL